MQERLGMVQRKSSRFVFSQWQRDSSPTNMMNQLKWKTLEAQRQIKNLIIMHKIIHNAIQIPLSFLPNRSRHIECIRFRQIHGCVLVYSNLFVSATYLQVSGALGVHVCSRCFGSYKLRFAVVWIFSWAYHPECLIRLTILKC